MQPSLTNYNADTPKTLKHTIEEIEKTTSLKFLKRIMVISHKQQNF